MQITVEVPDDLPEDQIASLRSAAKDGMWIIVRRPKYLSNADTANFVIALEDVLRVKNRVAAGIGQPQMEPAWRHPAVAG